MPDRRRALIEDRSLCFEVGRHLLRLEKRPEGWAVSVDGLSHGDLFPSQAEAWREGVRTALALEEPVPPPALRNGPRRDRSGGPLPEPGAAGAAGASDR